MSPLSGGPGGQAIGFFNLSPEIRETVARPLYAGADTG